MKGRKKPTAPGRVVSPGGAVPAKKKQVDLKIVEPRETAESMALRQREISVSEFFMKNRHLLGFDNPRKALLTTIKEAVDNSIDACEEAGILPDISVGVKPLGAAITNGQKKEGNGATAPEERYLVVVEDNGPGIVKEQIPNIFGKLLYGSKFHRLKMSRGQQGIGISAAALYGQLTTGKGIRIISRTSPGKPAEFFEVQIDTARNKPVTIGKGQVEWKSERGTRVEIELVAKYLKGRQSIDEYLEETAIANPHVRLAYRGPDRHRVTFRRVSRELPPEPKEIKPHPYGVELGMLMRMLSESPEKTVGAFLRRSFSRVSGAVAKEICRKAKVDPKTRLTSSARRRQLAEGLYRAIGETKIMAPPTNCLSPIGEAEIIKGLRKQRKADWYAAVTRKPTVYRGNPFLVEAGFAYGGEQDQNRLVKVLRFANKVPLLYQKSSCAIHAAVAEINWKPYRLQQARGALPSGPLTIMVHFASAWVPFTSESKEAIAHYPEIMHETRLTLQELGRKLAVHISRNKRAQEAERKHMYVEKYIPHIAVGLKDILGFSRAEERRVRGRLKEILENGNGGKK